MTSRSKILPSRPCLLESLEPRQLLSAGALDPSFGLGGKAIMTFPDGGLGFATDAAVQSDGKTVVVGWAEFKGKNGSTFSEFAVARFNFDGSPDTTFGPHHDGTVLTVLGSHGFDQAKAVATQPDGKIVVAGLAQTRSGDGVDIDDFAVIRLLPNGALDNTFDGDGKKIVSFGGNGATDLVLQNDGKIVLVGDHADDHIIDPEPDFDFGVVRLNSDGQLDKSFDGDGKRTIGFGAHDSARAVAIDYTGSAATNPNFGKIIVVGQRGLGAEGRDSSPSQIAIVRLNTNGTRDAAFDGDGQVTTAFSGVQTTANAVTIQPGGRIVVAGTTGNFQNDASFRFALARYLPNGQLDSSFGSANNGRVETDFGARDIAFDLTTSSKGGLIVAGTASEHFGLAGYTANGQLDANFGAGGRVFTDFGTAGTAQFGVRLARGPGKRFVVVGGDLFKTARYLDAGANTIQTTMLDPNSTEQGRDPAVFLVDRGEALPVPTRVFFSVGGTARRPGTLPGSEIDYTVQGMTIPNALIGTPFVDIPANQSSAVVRLTAIDDARLEPDEAATFTVLPNAGYQVGASSSVTLNIEDNDAVSINFQSAGVVPAGSKGDLGLVFGPRGDGLSFGWDADNTGNARQRHNSGSPNALFDSFNHMQKNGANRKWELAVPNGLYQVTLAAGDPDAVDSIYKMNLEGTLALSGTPTGDTHWFTRTLNVQVNDGRLTLTNALGAKNNKIDFITITAVPLGLPAGHFNPALPINLVSLPIVTFVTGVKKDLGNTFAQALLQ
jgi:uncharacterized delta-60 repeat protein